MPVLVSRLGQNSSNNATPQADYRQVNVWMDIFCTSAPRVMRFPNL